MSHVTVSPETALLTDVQVAKLLSMSVGTIRRWRLTRTGPHVLKIGGAVRYHPADLADFIESCRSDQPASAAGATQCPPA
jgi:predicted DNA-binding transcriptional regulator AlpA